MELFENLHDLIYNIMKSNNFYSEVFDDLECYDEKDYDSNS